MSAPPRGAQAGFSLVAVVAGMTVMLIVMGAAMPSWKYVVQNEREQELVFRGDQIASAIERYQKKHGGANPASLEVLVKGKFLRKEYTDPMTKDGKWKFITGGEQMMPRAGGSPMPGRPVAAMKEPSRSDIKAPFVGVASKSEEQSLRLMNGKDHYDEWIFMAGRPRFLGKEGPPIPGVNASPGPPGAPPGRRPGTERPGQTK